MFIVIVAVLCASCLAELGQKGPQITERIKVPENSPWVDKEYLNKLELDDSMRVLCLNHIKDQIKSIFETRKSMSHTYIQTLAILLWEMI